MAVSCLYFGLLASDDRGVPRFHLGPPWSRQQLFACFDRCDHPPTHQIRPANRGSQIRLSAQLEHAPEHSQYLRELPEVSGRGVGGAPHRFKVLWPQTTFPTGHCDQAH